MAAPQWNGPHAKAKSVGEVKALFRHNDKDRRMETNHTNPHIDKSKTHENFTYRGLSYKEMCDVFDGLLASVDQGKPGSGKNARTLMQSVILYPPKGLTREQEKDWMMDAGRVLEARYGKNLIEIQFDMDEEHEYTDKDTGEKVMSRNHGHARLFPEVGGKLNGKAFSSRAEIKALNHALDVMSVQKYGVRMMDGSKKKGNDPVEVLKVKSLRAEVEQLEERAATIVADAVNRAAEITTEANRDARATRREADQDRAAAKRERGAAWADAQAVMDDADDYARRRKSQADQDAAQAKKDAQDEADRIRQQAQADAQKITDAAEERARTIETALNERIRKKVEDAKAEKDKAINARNAAVAALQGDYETWGRLSSRPTAMSLLGVLEAAVKTSRAARPMPQSDVAGAYDRLMAMMGQPAQADVPGPTAVEGPTM